MKRTIKSLFNKLPKRFIAAAAVVTAIALPVSSIAANQVKLEGSLGVANVTAGDTKYARSVDAKYDQVVKLQVYYHNQELPDSGKVANNLKVKIAIPNQPGKTQKVNATIGADNSNTINDQVTVNLDRSDAYLEYIPGSAVWKHNAGTNENVNFVEQKISDNVVYGGQGLVIENAKPCFNFEATVTVLARVRVPGISVDKTVRIKGQKDWTTSNTAKPGDTLEYQIAYKNQGNVQHKNVVIRDNLPPKMEYVTGSTKLKNSAGVKNVADGVTKTGLSVGNYNPGAAAYVLFEVKVPTADKLQCGVTEFRNVGVARPEGMNEFYNTAITRVEKKCEDKPAYSCDLLEVKQLGDRKISATVRYTANNGAEFKNVTFNFGDGSTPLVTDKTTVEYTYAKDGSFDISAAVRVNLNGKEEVVTGEVCTSKVTFESGKPVEPETPTTPTELPNTGAGSVAGIVAAVTAAGAVSHNVVSRRKR
jgi:uncharacterized repeat protein (TIGR01451 family)